MDGISGILPYNAFKIPDDRLPERYRGKGYARTLLANISKLSVSGTIRVVSTHPAQSYYHKLGMVEISPYIFESVKQPTNWLTIMSLHDFLLFGYQLFATMFVLGVASVVLSPNEEDDDDDDRDGGILQPVGVSTWWYVTDC